MQTLGLSDTTPRSETAGFVAWKLVGQGFGAMQILFLALLLSNVRAIWLADAWRGKTGRTSPRFEWRTP
jgi:hypothetical protein